MKELILYLLGSLLADMNFYDLKAVWERLKELKTLLYFYIKNRK